jgi:Flp pilus assembly protein TadD
MKIPRAWLLLVLVALAPAGGCRAKQKEISSVQRKEAAVLAGEAQFAVSVHDFSRAEGLLAKAVAFCPDTGEYWVSLGASRVRLNRRDEARTAYQNGLAGYEAAATKEPKDAAPVLQQIYVLALLGRLDDARARLADAERKFPDDRRVRTFVQGRQLDRMLTDPKFKEIGL